MSAESKDGLCIGMVAGEASGDLLGAGLIAELQSQVPDLVVEGIGGPRMIDLGMRSHVPMERLSVMGLVEVLGRLSELLGVRKRLVRYFLENPPAVFVGIDAPDFVLALERKLKHSGIKTVQYVSPQVWAWRQGRIKKIADSVDLVLALFPFEADFYRAHNVPVRFVGHPLADEIPLKSDKDEPRAGLGFASSDQVLTLLPGSRMGEVKRLTPLFLETAKWCSEQQPGLKVVVAAANQTTADQIQSFVDSMAGLPDIKVFVGRTREAIAAADSLLAASGTVTLEVALVKRPMVVAYRVAPLTYQIMRRMVKVPYIALPNLLAGRMLAPEFLQDQAQPAAMGKALLNFINNPEEAAAVNEGFTEIHYQLKQNASKQAAQAVLELIGERS